MMSAGLQAINQMLNALDEQIPEKLEELRQAVEKEATAILVPVVPQTSQHTLDATGGDRATDTWDVDGYQAMSIIYDIPVDVDATLTLNETDVLKVTDGQGRSGTFDVPRGTIQVDKLEFEATNNAASAQDVGVWLIAKVGVT